MTHLNSNTEWKQWGKLDPLWSVASWKNKQKGAASAWTDQDFYALGESDWHDFLRQWQQYGLPKESCLEIGCGAGRITKQMALWFDRVDAVDVSPDMLDYARTRIIARNVRFSLTDGLHLPQHDCFTKAVFSTHVLQHLDTEELGLAQFREVFRVLDTGGTMMVHLPLYNWPSNLGRLHSSLERLRALEQALSNLRARIKRNCGVNMMRSTSYSMGRLHTSLTGLGFKNIEFRTFPTTSNGHLHPFVFASK